MNNKTSVIEKVVDKHRILRHPRFSGGISFYLNSK